jgi:transcription antitermination factor NusG
MAIPQAEKMLEQARKGERLSSSERRHCIAYLMGMQADMTNAAIAELFGVTERQIRKDREKIRSEKAKLIKEEDIGLVIADISMACDNAVREIERGKKKSQLGSRTHLEYVKASVEMQLKKVKALQELGYYPHNIGNMTVEKYEYRAIVSKDGSVDTRPVHIAIEIEESERQRVIEGEFEDVKRLPAPATA